MICAAIAVALLLRCIGAVRASGAHREFEPQRPLLAKAQRPRTARLAIEAAMAKYLRVVFGEVAGSPGPKRLLVRHRRQCQPPMQFLAQLVEIEKGEDRGRGAAFHVAGAAPVDAAVNQRPAPGVLRPALAVANREHIDMAVEREVAPR